MRTQHPHLKENNLSLKKIFYFKYTIEKEYPHPILYNDLKNKFELCYGVKAYLNNLSQVLFILKWLSIRILQAFPTISG